MHESYMELFSTTGWILAIVALFIAGLNVPHWRRTKQLMRPGILNPLEDRIRERVTRKHGKQTRRVFQMAWTLLLLGVLLIIIAPDRKRETKVNPDGPTVPAAATAAPISSIWLFGVPVVLIIGGVILLLANRNGHQRVAGTIALLAGAGHEFYLVKDFKMDSFLKAPFQVDLQGEITAQLRKFGGLGPEYVTGIEGFNLGDASIKSSMNEKLNEVCQAWEKRGERQALFLVIGATDRVSLTPETRKRYDSNVGLARARAENVSERITACGVPKDRVLPLVSGPRTTPNEETSESRSQGYPGDRRVDVWAFWNWPESGVNLERDVKFKIGKSGEKR